MTLASKCSTRRRGKGWLLAAALCCGAPAYGQPAAGDDVEIARAHFATGQAYYEHGRFIDAAREFEEAYRLSPKAPLLYNVGKAYDGASDFARALDAYRRFGVASASAVASADVEFAQKRVQLLSSLVGRLTLSGARDGSTVQLDEAALGTTPLPAVAVNPGRHALAVAHEGLSTYRAKIDVPVGGTLDVAVQQLANAPSAIVSAAPATPAYKKWWFWTAAGGAVVVAGVIVAVVLTGSSSGPPTLTLPGVK